MAWQKSDPEVVAQRASEARIDLVMLLDEAGADAQQTADYINKHFEELVVLTECMGDWPTWVIARAMLARILDYGPDNWAKEDDDGKEEGEEAASP